MGFVLSGVVNMPIRDIAISIALGTLDALIIASLTVSWWMG